MALKYVDGDLIAMAKNGDFDVIVHGCNCFATMGGGIAATIAKEFPAAVKADKNFAKLYKGDINQAGKMSFVNCDLGSHKLTIINAYTQYQPGGFSLLYDTPENRLRWVREAFYNVKLRFANFNKPKIGIPKIGAGIAGGDWNKIAAVIEEVTAGADITVVNYKPS